MNRYFNICNRINLWIFFQASFIPLLTTVINVLTAPSLVKVSRHVFVTVSCNSSFDRTARVTAASELSSKLLFSSPPFAKDSYGEKKEKICNLWKKWVLQGFACPSLREFTHVKINFPMSISAVFILHRLNKRFPFRHTFVEIVSNDADSSIDWQLK